MRGIASRFESLLFGCDVQLPSARHGIAGVDDQVYEHLFQHADVGPHQRQCRRMMAMQGNILANDSLEHFAQIRDDIIQISRLRVHHLLSTEGEQLPGQVGGPFTGGADLIEAFSDLAGESHGFHSPQVGVATNDSQQIIKVMGNPAGELAYGLQLL